jgi:hypothetical protein
MPSIDFQALLPPCSRNSQQEMKRSRHTARKMVSGVFRLRWFLKTSYIPSFGDCDSLPVVMGPMDGICYVVMNSDTAVYASDDLGSAVIGNMDEGDYVMQLSSGALWVNVDLNVGSEQLDATGWVPRSLVIYQGACEGP